MSSKGIRISNLEISITQNGLIKILVGDPLSTVKINWDSLVQREFVEEVLAIGEEEPLQEISGTTIALEAMEPPFKVHDEETLMEIKSKSLAL